VSQAELFASDMSDERMDELIVEAAKKAGFYVIMAGAEVRGHCGTHHQTNTAIKIGMDQFEPRHLRSLFKNFLTLTMTESTNA
jgi:hypothetical protein